METIKIRNGMAAAIHMGRVKEVEAKFIEGMQKIPDIDKGLSYIAMAGVPGFHMEQKEALICQAIGKALDLWDLFPREDMGGIPDSIGAFPMNTGLKIKEKPKNFDF